MTDKNFADLGVADDLVAGLAAKGITSPFPIQELTLPLALQGADLIGQARTGSGKTLAFGLPLLQRVDLDSPHVQALVIVPTRELCLQVTDDLETAGRERGVRILSVYGGVPIEPQTETLRGGMAHIVVGTPGRLLDHVSRGNLKLGNCKALVLDEADEMLDMGFLPDVERLIEKTAEGRQSLLFSATMPAAVVALARRYMSHPTFMRAEVEEQRVPVGITQHFFLVHKLDKPRILARILQTPNRGGVFVFSRTKHMCDRLVDDLRELNVEAIAVHGDLRQATREKNLDRFRDNKVDVLVATEVAARGLDVDNVTHVINYDCPEDEKMYLHRVGRTGRAGADGVAITFATFNEVDRLKMIRKAIDLQDAPVEEIFSTSDLLGEMFDLPDDKPWDRMVRQSIEEGGRGGNGRPSSRDSGNDRGGDRGKGRGSKGGGRDGGRDGGGRGRGSKSGGERSGGGRSSGSGRGNDDRPAGKAKATTETSRDTETKARSAASSDRKASERSNNDESTDASASTGERSRTRTRSRASSGEGSSSRATSPKSNDKSDTSEKRDAAPSDKGNSSAKDSGGERAPRKRARAARPSDDAAPSRSRSARSPKSSSGSSDGEAKAETSSESRSDSGRSGSSNSRGGRSRQGSGRDSGSNGKRGRDDSRSSRSGGRSNDDNRGSGREAASSDDRPAVASEVPTAPGDEARGGGKPLHSRTVRVDNLP